MDLTTFWTDRCELFKAGSPITQERRTGRPAWRVVLDDVNHGVIVLTGQPVANFSKLGRRLRRASDRQASVAC